MSSLFPILLICLFIHKLMTYCLGYDDFMLKTSIEGNPYFITSLGYFPSGFYSPIIIAFQLLPSTKCGILLDDEGNRRSYSSVYILDNMTLIWASGVSQRKHS